MRDFAAEAEVSFATPFNQFGSKVAIMRALSAHRIALMQERLAAAALPKSVSRRLLAAVKIAAEVMLAEPEANKAVMGVLGAPTGTPGDVSTQSAALWAAAIGKGDELDPTMITMALNILPEHLAIAFRGVLSFWTAGEFGDEQLLRHAQAAAAVTSLGFVTADGRAELASMLAGRS